MCLSYTMKHDSYARKKKKTLSGALKKNHNYNWKDQEFVVHFQPTGKQRLVHARSPLLSLGAVTLGLEHCPVLFT